MFRLVFLCLHGFKNVVGVPFSKKEIFDVFQLYKEKTLGSTDFPSASYQHCWSTMGKEMLKEFLEFYDSGVNKKPLLLV